MEMCFRLSKLVLEGRCLVGCNTTVVALAAEVLPVGLVYFFSVFLKKQGVSFSFALWNP